MNGLLSLDWLERGDACCHGSEGLLHAFARRSADDIVAIERCAQRNGVKKVFFEFRAEDAQFVDGQIAELDAFLQGKANDVADLLMRSTERKAFVNEICGCGQ